MFLEIGKNKYSATEYLENEKSVLENQDINNLPSINSHSKLQEMAENAFQL